MKRIPVRHAHIEHAVASLIPGPEFRIHALDPAIPHWYMFQALPRRIVAALSLGVGESVAQRVDSLAAPVIARVQGAALGGGMGLCAVSDVVLATTSTRFGFTEAKLGIIPAVISTFVLPKIGESHARALFTTGQRFDAHRAQAMGLVHEVLADVAALDARVDALLDELRGAGPTAARAAKALVRELRSLGPDEARRHTVRHIAQQRTSAEGREGLAAFLQKRPPSWSA